MMGGKCDRWCWIS